METNQQGIYSVVLDMRRSADHPIMRVTVLHAAPYSMALAWKAECELAIENKDETNVAYKAFVFAQSITGGAAYGNLLITA